MKIPTVLTVYLTLVVLLTLGVGSTIFLKPTPKLEVWTVESYNHCWIKHTVTITHRYGHEYEKDNWDTVCEERTYRKPITWR